MFLWSLLASDQKMSVALSGSDKGLFINYVNTQQEGDPPRVDGRTPNILRGGRRWQEGAQSCRPLFEIFYGQSLPLGCMTLVPKESMVSDSVGTRPAGISPRHGKTMLSRSLF